FTPVSKDAANNPLGPITSLISVPGQPNLLYAGVSKKGVYRADISTLANTQRMNWAAVNSGFIINDSIDNDLDGTKNDADDLINGGARVILAASSGSIFAAFIGYHPALAKENGGSAFGLIGLFCAEDFGAAPDWAT